MVRLCSQGGRFTAPGLQEAAANRFDALFRGLDEPDKGEVPSLLSPMHDDS